MSAPGTPPAPAARRHISGASCVLAARGLGALALLSVGAVHLHEYFKFYSEVPTIGTLFVLNFVGATVVGLALLAPVERIAGFVVALLALAGIGHAATSFVFLWIAERTPLFGFQEPGYDPTGIVASRGAEIATVVLLGAFLALWTRQHRRST
jgi:hypothetical protein